MQSLKLPLLRPVLFVVFPGALLLDLSGPLEAFELSCELSSPTARPYSICIASVEGGLVKTSSGVEIMTHALADVGAVDTLVVVGGPGVHEAARDPRLLQWLVSRASSARRLCSVCTGAFVLAAAGQLQGRHAVTHWGSCTLLQEKYPGTIVTPDAIYLRDGAVWTSAGVTAGIDLALALIEEDRGHQEAFRVARRLVVFLKRPGGQTQFSVPLSLQESDGGRFAVLHEWMQRCLGEDLRVETLAERVGMSPRSFARLYVSKTGRTPAKVVEAFRLEAARRALEETQQSLKVIAVQCGFQDEERMRRAFKRQIGVGPQDYRDRFNTCDGRFVGIGKSARRTAAAGVEQAAE